MAFGLARFDLTTLTARMELPRISEDPAKPITLALRFLGVGNRDWEAWRFARDAAAAATEDAKKATGTPPALPQRLAERRGETRDMLSAVGLVGWDNVLENGTPVAFSPETAARFLAEMHDALPVTLTEIAEFASTRSNFRPDPVIDPSALGKDAPRG